MALIRLYHVYALVIAQFRGQYDQYFLSFSYFPNLSPERLGEWDDSKIQETRILALVQGKRSITIILVIIFWNFTTFWYRSNSPQLKRKLISSIANLVYELPNDLRPRILGNIRKISNLGGGKAQCPVSLQEIGPSNSN